MKKSALIGGIAATAVILGGGAAFAMTATMPEAPATPTSSPTASTTAEPSAAPAIEPTESATPEPTIGSADMSAYDRLYAELHPVWDSTISLEGSLPEIVANACNDVDENRQVWAVNSETEDRSRFINGIIEEATTYGLCD